MKLELRDFLRVLDQNSESKQGLARTWVAFGGDHTFSYLEMRSFFRESRPNNDLLEQSYAPRGMFLASETAKYGGNDKDDLVDTHMPELYRIQLRPRDYKSAANELTVWNPSNDDRNRFKATAKFETDDKAYDILAVQIRKLKKMDADEVTLPALRLADGAIHGRLMLNETDHPDQRRFKRYINIDVNARTIFGLGNLDLQDDARWPVTVTPLGIEFDASVPDPTRGFGSEDEEDAQIVGRFRLETLAPTGEDDGGSAKKVGRSPYLLRLIGTSKVSKGNVNKTSIKSIEAARERLVRAMGTLLATESPARFRLDDRGIVPPLTWPLDHVKAGSVTKLAFSPVPGTSTEPLILIDTDAIDLRLRTKTDHQGAEEGLARVHPIEVAWLRSKNAFEIKVQAGQMDGDRNTAALSFKHDGMNWTKALDEPIKDIPVHLPESELRERLTKIYRDAAALAPDTPAPYAFLTTRSGWLQYPLKNPDEHGDTSTSLPEAGRVQAISGRIVFAIEDAELEVSRALSIDDAEGLEVIVSWNRATNGTPLETISLRPIDAAGQFLGFLFAAETSPTSREAVPVWTRGDAGTREVPLWFGSREPETGRFSWDQTTNKYVNWSLQLNVPPESKTRPMLAWVVPGRHPFVTNYPLSRTVQSSPTPSLTRGLLPYKIKDKSQLVFHSEVGTSPPEDELPELRNADDGTVPGKLYRAAKEPDENAPYLQSLILPTLHGVEFKVASNGTKNNWGYTARLRYDLPVLDELFAWSDPPPPELADQQGGAAKETGAPEIDNGPEITSLDPGALAKTWRASEKRMQLTWTQDAVVSGDTILTDGTPTPIGFDAVAAPWTFSTNVQITLSEDRLYGDLKFLDLSEQPSDLEGAVVGLGGRVTPDDAVLGLKVEGNMLKHDTSGDPPISVAGYAADLYEETKGDGFLFDNRGAALAQEARPANLREARLRTKASGDPHRLVLLTSSDSTLVESKIMRFGFFVRDLPVAPATSGFEFLGFDPDGVSDAINSVEGMRSFRGTAFDKRYFLESLYEWRCFPLTEDVDPELLGRYEIAIGPYQFRPLRLAKARFAVDGIATELSILGSLSYRNPWRDPNEAFAFDADRVYDRDDLLLLTARKAEGARDWSIEFAARSLTDGTHNRIKLTQNRDPSTRFQRYLRAPTGSEFNFDGEIASDIRIVFDKTKPNLSETTAFIDAHLFGDRKTFETTDVSRDLEGNLTLTFGDLNFVGVSRARLKNASLIVRLTNDENPDTLEVRGLLVAETANMKLPEEARTLLSYGNGQFKWLDLNLPLSSLENAIEAKIDHDVGAILLTLARTTLTERSSPLFDLAFAGAAEISGRLTGVFGSDSDGALATGHLQFEVQGTKPDQNTIRHVMLFAPLMAKDEVQNDIFLNWTTDERTCPIEWPVGKDQIALVPKAGQSLEDIAKGPLVPMTVPTSKAGAQFRILKISPGGPVLRHHVALVLKDHRIDADLLVQANGSVRPAETIRLLAATQHKLTWQEQNGKEESLGWWSLDHVGFTTAQAMQEEGKRNAFVPRQSRRGRARLKYRGKAVAKPSTGKLPEGVAEISGDNVAGFHDAAMRDFLWQKGSVGNATIILGNTAAYFPLEPDPATGRSRHAHVAMLPWIIGLPDGMGFQQSKTERHWRITTVDSWAAHGIDLRGDISPAGVNTGMTSDALSQVVRRGGLETDPARLIPVEAAFFEPWVADKPGPIDDEDHHREAPYFLRALLALRARWHAGRDSWSVETIIPRPSAGWNDQIAVPLGDDPGLRRISMKTLSRDVKVARSTTEPANLVVLSREKAERLIAYREIPFVLAESEGASDHAELREMAELTLDKAVAAIRIVAAKDAATKLVAQLVTYPADPLLDAGRPLTPEEADIVASPAIGWPYPPEIPPDELPIMAAHISPDRAHQAPAVGFSGRSQRLAWPARALGVNSVVRAIYASFGQHVIYDRGENPFDFDGPAARHLSPVPTRRRAPEDTLTKAALTPLAAEPPTSAAATAPEPGRRLPLTPPVVERFQIGRRPGAIEVSTSSITLTKDFKNRPLSLDAGWPGMGRPADSGPVAAHQLRTPRSTVLPADPSPDTIGFRRRTYLSLADKTPFPANSEEAVLDHFKAFPGSLDVIRVSKELDAGNDSDIPKGAGPVEVNNRRPTYVYWRITAEGKSGTNDQSSGLRLAPDWQGTLKVELTGLNATDMVDPSKEEDPSKILGIDEGDLVERIIAVLDLDGFVVTATQAEKEQIDRKAILTLSFPSVEELQARLYQATADTPMALTLKFPFASDTKPERGDRLINAPNVEMVLPVTLDPGERRVVKTRAMTIAFGDPSYDRSLAGPTATGSTRVGDTTWRLAADRHEYNRDSLLYLAFGPIDVQTDEFAAEPKDLSAGLLTFERIPAAEPGGAAKPAEKLKVRIRNSEFDPEDSPLPFKLIGEVILPARTPVQLRLTDLLDENGRFAPMAAGDALVVKVNWGTEGKTLTVRPRIVAAPVIAPPPSIFTVIETLRETEAGPVSRIRLHAASALPTRLEMPDLLKDLARGHVRRQGLFVWHYSTPKGPASDPKNNPETELLKLDRSGGAQLPQKR